MEISKFTSNNQTKLYAYDKIFLNFVNLHGKNKLPPKILFSGQKGIGKSTFAYHLINYIFSKNEDFKYNIKNFQIDTENRSFNLVSQNSHPNFHQINVLDGKKNIEINQIRKMINYSNKSTFNNKEKIILIDEVENLNLNSTNSLLKIIEEPNEKVFFILIHDNSKKLLSTLRSRCLQFNFHLSSNKNLNITKKIINDEIENFLNIKFINKYNTVGDYIDLIKFSQTEDINLKNKSLKDFLINLIDNKFYKKNDFIKKNIYKFIETYFLSLIKLNKYNNNTFMFYRKIIFKINNMKRFNLDEESFFIELRSKVLND